MVCLHVYIHVRMHVNIGPLALRLDAAISYLYTYVRIQSLSGCSLSVAVDVVRQYIYASSCTNTVERGSNSQRLLLSCRDL